MKLTTIFLTLCLSFLIYSLSIYMTPLSIKEDSRFDKQEAAEGKLVWQKYNCQSCHQLYGLGGYLGPDLTNVFSDTAKREKYIHTILQSGIRQMPMYDLSKEEFTQLISFLKMANASGVADPRQIVTDKYGMINQHEKN